MFDGVSPSFHTNISLSHRLIREIDVVHTPNSNVDRVCSIAPVRWFPPQADYIKLNLDDATSTGTDRAGLGIILCNSSGNLIFAKTTSIGLASALDAECQAARMGLFSDLTLGINNICIEGDSNKVISMLGGDLDSYP